MIASRDFIAVRKRADSELLLPGGTLIAITGGPEYQDHRRIWDALDRVLAKHPDMVLLHGGTPSGVEHIAACWARSRTITAIIFRPDWSRHAKAAPFKRNDLLREQLPAGLIYFPGTGISANLADTARKMGIPVWKFERGDALMRCVHASIPPPLAPLSVPKGSIFLLIRMGYELDRAVTDPGIGALNLDFLRKIAIFRRT